MFSKVYLRVPEKSVNYLSQTMNVLKQNIECFEILQRLYISNSNKHFWETVIVFERLFQFTF